MTEEPVNVGTLLEHRIAQAKADIEVIDIEVASLEEQAKALRVRQTELREVLAKLEAPTVAVPEEPEEPVPP